MTIFDGEISLFQFGLDALARMVAARYGAMHILSEQGETIHFLHTGIRKEEAPRLAGEAPPKGFGLLGTLEEGEVIRLEVLTKERKAPGLLPPSHPRVKHLLGVPLAAKGRVYGQVYLAEKTGGAFTQEDEELALNVASKVAMAVESRRREKQWRNQLETFHRLSREFTEERNPTRLLRQLVDAATELIGADYGILAVFDREGRIAQFLTSGLTSEERDKTAPWQRAQDFLRAVCREEKTVRLDDLATNPQGLGFLPAPARSLVAMCVRFREESFGTLCLTKKVGTFSAEDEQLLVTLSANAATAIQHARLFETVTQKADRWEALYRLASLLSRSLDLDQAYPAVAATLKAYLPFDRIGVVIVEKERLVMTMSVAEPPLRSAKGQAWTRMGATAVEWVLDHRQARLIRDLAVEQAFDDERLAAQDGIRSTLMVPLLANGEILGVLVLESRVAGSYKEQDLDLLGPLAERFAMALQNARVAEGRRLALEDLKAAQERLIRGETFRALGEMASSAAHHLNNMLAIIVGRIQVLRMTMADPAIQGSLEVIEQATIDAAETVRRLQAFGRARPSAEMVPVDLVRIAEESLESTRPLWRDEAQVKGIQIEPHLELGQIPPVSGVASELREVVANLILNAIDAMPAGGRITLKSWAEKEAVCLSVSDNGVGVSDEARRRAFEPFFTTKGMNRAGLGLSVAYRIVQRVGGEISLESLEGKGTTVTLRFPSGAGQIGLGSANPHPSSTAGQAPSVSPARILVIDDEPGVRSVLAEVLSTQGHAVNQAASGPEGLAMLEGGHYDLVITDLGMPGMTGWEVAREVKSRWPGTPVLLITGWGEFADREDIAEHGVDALLLKPFSLEKLRALLARLLGEG